MPSATARCASLVSVAGGIDSPAERAAIPGSRTERRDLPAVETKRARLGPKATACTSDARETMRTTERVAALKTSREVGERPPATRQESSVEMARQGQEAVGVAVYARDGWYECNTCVIRILLYSIFKRGAQL